MKVNEISVCWNSHKNYISKGFCSLQQNEEFTDMTLAAGGHFVKVHRNIIALASPYLKAMLESVSGQYPIVFLNKVSHPTLCYMLEFIYTGEVKIPSDFMSTFAEACKELHIRGSENLALLQPPKQKETSTEDQQLQESITDKGERNIIKDSLTAAQIVINQNNTKEDIHFINNIIPNTEVQDLTAHTTSHENSNYPVEPLENHLNNIVEQSAAQIIIKPQNYDLELIPFEKNSNVITEENETALAAAQITINPQNYSLDSIESSLNMFSAVNDSTNAAAQFTMNTQNYNLEVIPMPDNSTAINGTDIFNTTFPQIKINPQNFKLDSMEYNSNNIFNEPCQSYAAADDVNMDSEIQNYSVTQNKEAVTDNQDEPDVNSYNIITQKKRMHKKRKKFKYDSEFKPVKKSIVEIVKQPHFSITQRGSLQMLMNRFIYLCHHISCGGYKRRWRCIDYRKLHCPAVVDTVGETIVNRSDDHSHAVHNNKTLKIIRNNLVFTSLHETLNEINGHNKSKEAKTENTKDLTN